MGIERLLYMTAQLVVNQTTSADSAKRAHAYNIMSVVPFWGGGGGGGDGHARKSTMTTFDR